MTERAEGSARVALRNILLATDFSHSSDAALAHAASIARRYDAKMFLAHVIRPDAYQLVPPEATTVALEQTRRYAEQQMASLLISGRLRDIPHQVLLGTGELWPVLSDLMSRHEIDLIVVGTHGRTGVRKLLLGSAAEEIFRMASCPVLTVGPKVETPADATLVRDPLSRRRFLYATDFTAHSERAAAYAVSLAQENQAHLTLLHVVKEAADVSEHNRARLVGFVTKRLRALLPDEADLWCEPEIIVQFGEPADAILKVAAETKAELIALGVRKAGTFPGHLPPATAYKVVCQATCPVLTVRG
ncbi:MAG TPA: universal stress protein [Candidatus Acidoferrales bacterium]|nr:universal stress protein [Candidatus Acidoferrales bacterium]